MSAILYRWLFISYARIFSIRRRHTRFDCDWSSDVCSSDLQVFSKSPVIGIGYDNLCLAYQKYIGIRSLSSHACSGSDSSILFILATTGIAGFLVFVFSVIQISNLLSSGAMVQVLASTFAALLIHSLFANSIFYPWIMGW